MLVSDADVAFEGTMRLMTRVQRELFRGRSPAAALRLARRELLDGGRYSDPYYWSSFRLIGAAHEPLFPGGLPQASANESSVSESNKTSIAWFAILVFVSLSLLLARIRHRR